jgi:hypothetical protein
VVNYGKNETKIKTTRGNDMQKQFDEIFQKRMDRKDFLKHVAMGVAVITGAAGVVKLLKPEGQNQQVAQKQEQTAFGYGANTYGGRQVTAQKS